MKFFIENPVGVLLSQVSAGSKEAAKKLEEELQKAIDEFNSLKLPKVKNEAKK